jgi:hypothetical protein
MHFGSQSVVCAAQRCALVGGGGASPYSIRFRTAAGTSSERERKRRARARSSERERGGEKRESE